MGPMMRIVILMTGRPPGGDPPGREGQRAACTYLSLAIPDQVPSCYDHRYVDLMYVVKFGFARATRRLVTCSLDQGSRHQ